MFEIGEYSVVVGVVSEKYYESEQEVEYLIIFDVKVFPVRVIGPRKL